MSDPKAKAREGLLTHDHSKRGRRYVSILDPLHGRVTLLEPWEHAVLVLCDGTRTARQILDVLDRPVEGESIDLRSIQRSLKYFELQDLIEPIGLSEQSGSLAGPRTLAGLQQAFREWHKDPVRTGQILSGIFPAPFSDPLRGQVPIGLEPTVALPEDEAKSTSPVAIGTKLVVGEGDADERPMRSLLDDPASSRTKTDDPSTLIGSLTGGEAEIPQDEFQEDGLSIGGKLTDLLAAVDNDFAEVEKRERAQKQEKRTPPPVGKAIAGVAEVPRARSLTRPDAKVWLSEVPEKPATRVIFDPDLGTKPTIPRPVSIPIDDLGDVAEEVAGPTDEATMRSIQYPEASIQPTLVLSETASAPSSKVGSWVGAVVSAQPNSSESSPQGSLASGALLEESMPFGDVPTEGDFRALDPIEPRERRTITEPIPQDQERTNETSEHISSRARDVFERLRKAGLKARTTTDNSDHSEGGTHHTARRKDDKAAQRFEQALVSLTAGDLELALAHFRALGDQMPNSKRVRGFIEAIESVRGEQSITRSILDDFEAALEDAIAYGRCPKCFSMMAPDQAQCFACGFKSRRSL